MVGNACIGLLPDQLVIIWAMNCRSVTNISSTWYSNHLYVLIKDLIDLSHTERIHRNDLFCLPLAVSLNLFHINILHASIK